jgi:hypothetical protein
MQFYKVLKIVRKNSSTLMCDNLFIGSNPYRITVLTGSYSGNSPFGPFHFELIGQNNVSSGVRSLKSVNTAFPALFSSNQASQIEVNIPVEIGPLQYLRIVTTANDASASTAIPLNSWNISLITVSDFSDGSVYYFYPSTPFSSCTVKKLLFFKKHLMFFSDSPLRYSPFSFPSHFHFL